ncbi:MAG: ChaN family lipoprotein [Rubrivivax sp.]|nr:ChaN family lipoprotein [Rubrivivax sp.]
MNERGARPPLLQAATAARVSAAALASLVACSTPTTTPPLRFSQPVVLLGEVHDNAAQHALRLDAFRAWIADGARPALALEQFDRDKQPLIDQLLAQTPKPDADTLIAAAGSKGWLWQHYRPFIALAIEHGLPVVAANVGRDEARQVMRGGLAAAGFGAEVPLAVLNTQARGIEASHCGMLDAATSQRMALAQVARDQFMAQVLQTHADRGVVLLAGNGHVRTDLGVPLWLPPEVRARSEAIGMLEVGDTDTAYDRRLYTVAQARADPCEAMRAPRR